MDRLSLKEAAEVLGISEDGVRKRVKRGSIPHDRDESGKLYVYLDASKPEADTSPDGSGDPLPDRLIEELREQNRRLWEELEHRKEEGRRKDHLLAAALERIPAIEAPRDEPHGPETPDEKPEGSETPEAAGGPETVTERRSWWKRFFGFE